MFKYSSSIYVSSKLIKAEDIEKILNIKFDEKREIGQPFGKIGKLKFDENYWILKSDTAQDLPLENHINNLFEKIGSNIKNFALLGKNCEVQCSCYIKGDNEVEDYNPEINLTSDLIKKLSLINASIDVDLYILNE